MDKGEERGTELEGAKRAWRAEREEERHTETKSEHKRGADKSVKPSTAG